MPAHALAQNPFAVNHLLANDSLQSYFLRSKKSKFKSVSLGTFGPKTSPKKGHFDPFFGPSKKNLLQ